MSQFNQSMVIVAEVAPDVALVSYILGGWGYQYNRNLLYCQYISGNTNVHGQQGDADAQNIGTEDLLSHFGAGACALRTGAVQ